jgi:hypothetical protein
MTLLAVRLVAPVPPWATVTVVPDVNTVPVASGSVIVRLVLLLGEATVKMPVPLALPCIFT